jgi:hypothetical protein
MSLGKSLTISCLGIRLSLRRYQKPNQVCRLLAVRAAHLLRYLTRLHRVLTAPFSLIVKDGQRTLQSLDEFRYVEALEAFGKKDPSRPMGLEDVEHLVEWKL